LAKKSGPLVILVALMAVAALFSYQQGILDPLLKPGNGGDDETDGAPEQPTEAEHIKVAAFNIQIFGQSKRGKPEVMEVLVDVAREFDVMLVQEIRDSSGETAPAYLDLINGEGTSYAYVESERLGRSTSKESYAYYWNTETVEHLEGTAYVYNDTGDVFEREPYVASFRSGGFDFTLVGIHTKPDDAEHEIGNLTVVVASVLASAPGEGDVIVMGDFNADGGYFDEDGPSPLKGEGYHWIVENSYDTMTKTDWTYDRMVLLDSTYLGEYVTGSCEVFYFDAVYGVGQELMEDVSDHYPVYAVFRTDLADDD
jgi:endonuclease/exonuclease/phosphatase family metal-dependent hydrolase